MHNQQGSRRLLAFGPQPLSLDGAALRSLRENVTRAPANDWIIRTIDDLPSYLKQFEDKFPAYRLGQSAIQLERLREWLNGGREFDEKQGRLPNIVLSPILVTAHLCQYMEYMEQEGPSSNEPDADTIGHCMGLLSAVVASTCRSQHDVKEHGPAAIRLAMLVGAAVDARDATDARGPSRSLATSWQTDEAGEILKQTLKHFPEAYVSVSYDERRATVTTAESTSSALCQELRRAGIVATEIGLYGRFHSSSFAEDIEEIIDFCDAHPGLSLPDVSALVRPTWLNSGEDRIRTGKLHDHVLRAILVVHSNWYPTFKKLYEQRLRGHDVTIVPFGPEPCVPPSIDRLLERDARPRPRKEDDIAVVGMSVKVAGADDAADFWRLLKAGESQHGEVPRDRVPFPATGEDTKWFANLINDPDAFDQKFFKRTAREAASMDPQQRILLQVAYQALEQAGYFTSTNPSNSNVGCYVGVCAADYENNAASNGPNAFTATGNLKSFIAGKVSHYFGWTGPGMCIDTACSSSLVAVHMACKSILSGECHSALAAGVNIITNPQWFRNLAAASFLSPTGQCKPFDADADGYCRGEGFAAVYLKRMSTAIAEGDQILGVISSSAINQNQNCTPIFVPNQPSLSDLFYRVVGESRLSPSEITYVEAHGTGTQVGDPAEYSSIRQVLGGAGVSRQKPLALGSVKGLVGHTECASGAVSLVKCLLMVQQKAIPPQASYKSQNPHLEASPDDNIDISTTYQNWDADFRAALINNYGASGSNASMTVTQAPHSLSRRSKTLRSGPSVEFPVRICAKDTRSLREYSLRLLDHLRSTTTDSAEYNPANLAFNICRQSNPNLDQAAVLGFRTRDQLMQRLGALANGEEDVAMVVKQSSPRPVVLCFGGQISTYVGLSKDLYDNVTVFRKYLDRCDTTCRSIGCDSIYPVVFQRHAITDPVKLQTALFATQYACAQTWMECGVRPVAVIGHSFGELTSLCVSGVLSLEDALKMISGRAAIIRDDWAEEKGSMLAIEADLSSVEDLLSNAARLCQEIQERAPTIACFNGPRSFTVAASSTGIDTVINVMTKNAAYSTMRFKRLNVTHAFHSVLTEPLASKLHELGKRLAFGKPDIHLERATEFSSQADSGTGITDRYVAEHMRNPVYFYHAVNRLAKQYPSAVWLEAGSNSTITNMASRAANSPGQAFFQSLNLSTDNSLQFLANATMSLWREGLPLTFWTHHRAQTYDYTPLLLPAYQFEKSRHWIELVPSQLPGEAILAKKDSKSEEEIPKGLWTFMEHLDEAKMSARFRVNTMTEEYLDLVSGHVVAGTAAICPATVELEIVLNAISSLLPEEVASSSQPRITNVENQSPICINPNRRVWLIVKSENPIPGRDWSWKIMSDAGSGSQTSETVHATGIVDFLSNDDAQLQSEFSRYVRLVEHDRCKELLERDDVDDIIKGRHIYRAFGEVLHYSEQYRGLRKLVGRGLESAGQVWKKQKAGTFMDAVLADCFSQAAGIWVNCMTDKSDDDMYIAVGFDSWMRAPRPGQHDEGFNQNQHQERWDILAKHHHVSDQAFISDVFIFSEDGAMIEVILGVHYHKVSKTSMSRILSRLSSSVLPGAPANLSGSQPASLPAAASGPSSHAHQTSTAPTLETSQSNTKARGLDVAKITRDILAEITGLERESIQSDSQLADIGIDSLMAMELGRELEAAFKCPLPSGELMLVTDFGGLVLVIQNTLGVNINEGDIESNDGTHQSDQSSSDTTHTGGNLKTSDYSTRASSVSFADNVSGGLLNDKNADIKRDGISAPTSGDSGTSLSLPTSTIINAFDESKRLTDQFIHDYRCSGYMETVLPRQTQLCVALTVEALEQLGCPLRRAEPGQKLNRIPHLPEHQRLTEYLYTMLDHEARLINVDDGGVIVRTAVTAPSQNSETILAGLLRDFPDHDWANRLTYYAGSRLADVLTGKCDGIKLIFGTEEGRELVTGLYGDSLLNKLANMQMQDVLAKLVARIPTGHGPLKILELGAGTGGTTKGMAKLLSKLNVHVEYTFTDLSGSFVAAARKTFKEYPFMKFRVHDIEKEPAAELIGSQHIVLGSNAIHATHSLQNSLANVRKFLRPDGFLMMLEMTSSVFWVDMIFGLFEGWWLFDDDRRHAIAHQSVWERELHAVGYGHVDWTDGYSPELEIQRVIIALASGQQYDIAPLPARPIPRATESSSLAVRKAVVDEYIRKYTTGFDVPDGINNGVVNSATSIGAQATTVLVTGASGSLGTHLVAHLATLPYVNSIICLNRRSTSKAEERQHKAMEERGILLDAASLSKLQVIQTDTRKTHLGLPPAEYDSLVRSVTHIVHNAWPMSGKRPIATMEPQFEVMRNLIDLARDVAQQRSGSQVVTFQLISSISVVGYYGVNASAGGRGEEESSVMAPEERVSVDAVLPNGYSEAKFVCERMLDETLHQYPRLFRPMVVRLGQVAGSKVSGYWNPVEHLAFLIKSSQTLRALPDLKGDLCWTPLEDVAGTLADLALGTEADNPVYHIDNPKRQSWQAMLPVLCDALNIPPGHIVPFKEWVRRVRQFPGSVERDNPAALLVDFLDDNFLRMSCGGLLLDVKKTCEHSATLAAVGPVSKEQARRYVQAWKDSGFLS